MRYSAVIGGGTPLSATVDSVSVFSSTGEACLSHGIPPLDSGRWWNMPFVHEGRILYSFGGENASWAKLGEIS